MERKRTESSVSAGERSPLAYNMYMQSGSAAAGGLAGLAASIGLTAAAAACAVVKTPYLRRSLVVLAVAAIAIAACAVVAGHPGCDAAASIATVRDAGRQGSSDDARMVQT